MWTNKYKMFLGYSSPIMMQFSSSLSVFPQTFFFLPQGDHNILLNHENIVQRLSSGLRIHVKYFWILTRYDMPTVLLQMLQSTSVSLEITSLCSAFKNDK